MDETKVKLRPLEFIIEQKYSKFFYFIRYRSGAWRIFESKHGEEGNSFTGEYFETPEKALEFFEKEMKNRVAQLDL